VKAFGRFLDHGLNQGAVPIEVTDHRLQTANEASHAGLLLWREDDVNVFVQPKDFRRIPF
jgi:hypothetical protein